MDLLIIKTEDAYVRVKDNTCTAVGLEKASVFPCDRMAEVKELVTRVKESGFLQATIYRLTMKEELLEGGKA